MNSDPSMCRLIANPHRLKKNEIKVNIVRDKGKDRIKEYLRDEYKHLYISPNLISDLDKLIKDYLTDYEISLICEEMIQRVIARSKKYRGLDPEIIAFDNVDSDNVDSDNVGSDNVGSDNVDSDNVDSDNETDKIKRGNLSIVDMMIQGDGLDEEGLDEEGLDEEISDILDEYLSDEYLSDQLSDE